ncbi:MAG: oligoribonuclease [Chloroflexi bacterium]|nr:oligoribonuclease [Chloroflexota bacterium]
MSDRLSACQPTQSKHNMVWIDLEMKGLDPGRDVIIEVAVLITDGDLNIIADGPDFAVQRTKEELNVMNAWNRRTHHGSGLIKRVKTSEVSIEQAQAEIVEFVQQWTEKGNAPLCGNSVHQDKRFLYLEMPQLVDWLSYRIVDVSTVKELAKRWYPDLEKFVKQEQHRTPGEIHEAMDYLRW